MFVSGTWRGFWEQPRFGRQEMQAFELRFSGGRVQGSGVDIIGGFTVRGDYDDAGQVTLVKQYLGKHRVEYQGGPDGEGCILGTWVVRATLGDAVCEDRGPFLMRPDLARPTGEEPIREIGPRG